MSSIERETLPPPHALNMRQVYLQALEELALPFPATKLDGWNNFNRMVGGFRSREYTILCGPTGGGKTALLATWSAQLIKQNVKHFVASIETGHTDYMKRVISCFHGKDINTGDPVDPDELARIHVKSSEYLERDAIEFSLYDNRVDVKQLMYDIEYMVNFKGVKIAFIDNLNFFLEPTRSSDQLLEMDRVTHELIIFCKRIDVHIVMVMHPKKTDGGRIESEFDIKGSSTAVQEASNVFLFNRLSQDMIDSDYGSLMDRELKIAKLRRRGAFTGHKILLGFNGASYLDKGFWK